MIVMFDRIRAPFLILAGFVLAGFALLLFFQQRAFQDLARQNAILRTKAAEAELARAEAAPAALAPEDSSELQRLRASQPELLKLRGEVAQLRRQLQELQAASGGSIPVSPDTPTAPEQPASPIETYAARVHASVAWGQTLATGGWLLASGKRGVVLIQPELAGAAGQPGQLVLQTRIVEMPEEVFDQVGLNGLKSDGKQSSAQTILNPEQAEGLVKALGRTVGVDLLSAPKISTLDGRPAQLKVADTRVISGKTYESGPVVDIVPQISPDGNSVDLSVLAQLRLPVKTDP